MFDTLQAQALLKKYGNLDTINVSLKPLQTRVNSRVFALLLETLRSGENERRAEAARVLGLLGLAKDPRAVGPLLEALDDAEWLVRFRAAEALGELKDPGSIDKLIDVLEDDYWGTRRAAADALGGMKATRAVQPLLKSLGSKRDDQLGQARSAVIGALVQINDPSAAEYLIQALESGDDYAKETAAEALGLLRDARAIVPLIRALGEPADAIRHSAAHSLALLGEPQWQNCIKGDFRRDLFFLASSKDPRAALAFGKALGSADESVMTAAVDACAYYTGGDVGTALNAAFLRGNSHIRERIAEAFVKRRDTSAVEPLLEALAQNRSYSKEIAIMGDSDATYIQVTAYEAEFIRFALSKLQAAGLHAGA